MKAGQRRAVAAALDGHRCPGCNALRLGAVGVSERRVDVACSACGWSGPYLVTFGRLPTGGGFRWRAEVAREVTRTAP